MRRIFESSSGSVKVLKFKYLLWRPFNCHYSSLTLGSTARCNMETEIFHTRVLHQYIWLIIFYLHAIHELVIFLAQNDRKLPELIEVEKVMNGGIPVIRRFSGGGTVIVDKGTIFVTFICNKTAVDQLQPFPQPIMSWTGQFYSQVIEGACKFNLRENGT